MDIGWFDEHDYAGRPGLLDKAHIADVGQFCLDQRGVRIGTIDKHVRSIGRRFPRLVDPPHAPP